jgi:hypothetical protein
VFGAGRSAPRPSVDALGVGRARRSGYPLIGHLSEMPQRAPSEGTLHAGEELTRALNLDANEILSVGWRRPLSLDACLNAGYLTLRLALSRPGSADDGSPLGSLRCCSPLQVRSPRSWVANASAAGGTRLSGSCLPYTWRRNSRRDPEHPTAADKTVDPFR